MVNRLCKALMRTEAFLPCPFTRPSILRRLISVTDNWGCQGAC